MNFTKMTDFLNYLVNDYGIPSVDCCIHQNGQEIYRYAAGKAYDETKDLYYIYSLTKPLTCVAALQLLERGKYLLNDPLSDYLPEFKDMFVKQKFKSSDEGRKIAEGNQSTSSWTEEPVVPAKNPIRIKHLFTMSAGFNYNLNSPAIQKYIKETHGEFPTRTIAKAIAEQPLDFEPGTHWQYSLCHDVLGAFIEVVSGKTLGEYMKENIFDPLGMTDTSFEVTPEKQQRLAPQFLFDDEQGFARQIENTCIYVLGSRYQSGGAGIVSSVNDYILFADMLANGGKSKKGEQILSPRTIEFMKTNQLTEEMRKDMNWPHLRGYGYGLGVRTMMDKAAAGSLSPEGELGWGGAAGSYLLVDTENKLALCYAQHMKNNKNAYIHPRLRNILYACI